MIATTLPPLLDVHRHQQDLVAALRERRHHELLVAAEVFVAVVEAAVDHLEGDGALLHVVPQPGPPRKVVLALSPLGGNSTALKKGLKKHPKVHLLKTYVYTGGRGLRIRHRKGR